MTKENMNNRTLNFARARTPSAAPRAAQSSDMPEVSDEALNAMTEDELRAHLSARGHDPDQQLAGVAACVGKIKCRAFLDKMGAAAAASIDDPLDVQNDMRRLPMVDEFASAGTGYCSDDTARPRTVALTDLFGRVDYRKAVFYRISGASMEPSGIRDGDCVLVKVGAKAKDGDVVVAYLPDHGEVVRQLWTDHLGPWLESTHPDYAALRPANPSELIIHGVVKGRAGKI